MLTWAVWSLKKRIGWTGFLFVLQGLFSAPCQRERRYDERDVCARCETVLLPQADVKGPSCGCEVRL